VALATYVSGEKEPNQCRIVLLAAMHLFEKAWEKCVGLLLLLCARPRRETIVACLGAASEAAAEWLPSFCR